MKLPEHFDTLAQNLFATPAGEHHPHTAKTLWLTMFSPKDEPEITDEQWEMAGDLSCAWNTCACGSLNDGLERRGHVASWGFRGASDYAPTDAVLDAQGYDFMEAIEERNWHKAKKVFLAIQRRGAKVVEAARKAGVMSHG